ncbi:hypothetical protein BKA62DRAFT_656418 [Auriculariales sp. MPI-PUGE-AT-0066]|nr:hypothetical protein BKA62DRAFT_656418 [Auriculariales sp. MPI-PUGE-AT-0066]
MAYAYNNNDYSSQGQPQPYAPSRGTTFRNDSYDQQPYSAGNSRQRLNTVTQDDDAAGASGGLRYRDDVNAGHRAQPSYDAGYEKGHAPRASNGSHFSPVSARFGQGEKSGYGDKESFKQWRSSHYGGIWTRGNGFACIGRFFCCTFLLTLLLIFSIVLTIAVYVRPPDVSIGSVALDTDAKTGAIERNSTALIIHLNVPITVVNPNFFDAAVTKVTATALYPIGSKEIPIGGGEKSGIVFKKGTNSTINFPLSFAYLTSIDPDKSVITDIAAKCGAGQRLPIKYAIKLDLKIVIPTISPTFSGSTTFPCPVSSGDLSILTGALTG